jgi:hypothetical protein
LNQRAVDAVVAHAARESRLSALSSVKRPRARRLAQGSVMPGITRTANAAEGGVSTMGLWIPAMAEVLRAGESAGAVHLAYSRNGFGPPFATSPGRLLVVPNEMERLIGWNAEGTPEGAEHTAFASRCARRGARIAWLDAGVHVPVTRGALSLFQTRRRETAALFGLVFAETNAVAEDADAEDSRDASEAALSPSSRTALGMAFASSFFAKLAPVLVVAAPFVRPVASPEALALACLVGATAAAQTFVYAVGFYVSSGARHLAKGAPGYVLYVLLFIATMALVPFFCAFEVLAAVTWPGAAPRRDAPRAAAGGGARRSDRSEPSGPTTGSSSDEMLGSDGEVRRWKSRGEARPRRNARGDSAGPRFDPPATATATATVSASHVAVPEAERAPHAARNPPAVSESKPSSTRSSSRADRWLKSAPVASGKKR